MHNLGTQHLIQRGTLNWPNSIFERWKKDGNNRIISHRLKWGIRRVAVTTHGYRDWKRLRLWARNYCCPKCQCIQNVGFACACVRFVHMCARWFVYYCPVAGAINKWYRLVGFSPRIQSDSSVIRLPFWMPLIPCVLACTLNAVISTPFAWTNKSCFLHSTERNFHSASRSYFRQTLNV